MGQPGSIGVPVDRASGVRPVTDVPTAPAPPLTDDDLWAEIGERGAPATEPIRGLVFYGSEAITIPPPPPVATF